MSTNPRSILDKGHDLDLVARRQSVFRRDSTSVDVTKQAALVAMRPQLRDKFNPTRVEAVLEETIKGFMKGKVYQPEDAEEWTTTLSSIVVDRVKLCKFPRYKVVALVTIGENIGGGVLSGMKTQWDNATDAYATYTYITDSLFVVGTVFGVYFY